MKIDRDMIANEITAVIERSDLPPMKRRRALRVMNGRFPWQRRARRDIIDKAVSELLAEELIVPTPEGTEAAIDWDAIASFIERMLPVVLQILALFGV